MEAQQKLQEPKMDQKSGVMLKSDQVSNSGIEIFLLFLCFGRNVSVHGFLGSFFTQKPTCSGGFTEVLTELKILPSHGQSFSGFRVDL